MRQKVFSHPTLGATSTSNSPNAFSDKLQPKTRYLQHLLVCAMKVLKCFEMACNRLKEPVFHKLLYILTSVYLLPK